MPISIARVSLLVGLSVSTALGCGTEDSGTAGSGGKGVDGGLGGTAGATTFDCTPPTGDPTPLALTLIGEGFARPVLVDSPHQDGERLFVGEQAGVISVFKNGELLDEPFADIRDRVESGGNEQGLLGLAFHPGYADNGRLFVHYTANGATAGSGDTVVSELRRAAENPERADLSSERVLLTVDQPEANHNGGTIQFRSDGMLYIGLGDGGGAGDAHGSIGNGQSLDTLLGKILRIDVDNVGSGQGYGSPGGNMSGGRPEIWSFGLRNPWRFSFDACSGDMYIGDVGQNVIEEIDVEPAGTGSGTNWGWKVMEGSQCFAPSSDCDTSGKTLPVAEYDHSQGCSVTGGYVYRGSAIPALRGTYIYADYCSSSFWSFRYQGAVVSEQRELTAELSAAGSVSSFGRDASGELYVTDFEGGRIWRIDAQ